MINEEIASYCEISIFIGTACENDRSSRYWFSSVTERIQMVFHHHLTGTSLIFKMSLSRLSNEVHFHAKTFLPSMRIDMFCAMHLSNSGLSFPCLEKTHESDPLVFVVQTRSYSVFFFQINILTCCIIIGKIINHRININRSDRFTISASIRQYPGDLICISVDVFYLKKLN